MGAFFCPARPWWKGSASAQSWLGRKIRAHHEGCYGNGSAKIFWRKASKYRIVCRQVGAEVHAPARLENPHAVAGLQAVGARHFFKFPRESLANQLPNIHRHCGVSLAGKIIIFALKSLNREHDVGAAEIKPKRNAAL